MKACNVCYLKLRPPIVNDIHKALYCLFGLFNVVQYDNNVINNNHPPAWISWSHQGGKQVIYNYWPNVIKLFCKSVQYNSHLSVLVMIWYQVTFMTGENKVVIFPGIQ